MPPVLVSIRPGISFTSAPAASFLRAERELGRKIDVNSSYRDWDTQQRWHNESVAYNAGKIPYPGHAYAVDPRYSEHCLGNAFDTDDWNKPGFLAFMADHGWIQTDSSKGEEHHLAYRAARDNHRNDTTPAGDSGTPINPEEDDMFNDSDRALLKAIAGQRPTLELVRAKGTAPVFFSANRTERVWVKNENILADYQFYLRSLGYEDAVKEVDSINSFGAITGDVPA